MAENPSNYSRAELLAIGRELRIGIEAVGLTTAIDRTSAGGFLDDPYTMYVTPLFTRPRYGDGKSVEVNQFISDLAQFTPEDQRLDLSDDEVASVINGLAGLYDHLADALLPPRMDQV